MLRRSTVALVGLLLLAGCSAGASDDSAPAGDGTPVDGGTLRYGLQADPVCLDPRQGGLTVSLTVTRSVVDSLTDQDPETGAIEPWLASSWETNADSSSFTFHLRDGVTFSDGTPLDAQAVKVNFDDTQSLGALAALPAQYLTGYQGATVVDPSTVRVDFDRPNAQFLQASSSMSLGLLSPKSLQDKTPEQLCEGDYAASGPFTITKFVAGQSVRIEKRTGYGWAPARAAHQGDAHLDAVDFTVVPEASVRSGSLASGQVDAVGDLPAQSTDQVRGSGLQVLTKPNPGLTGSFFVNTTAGPLADPAVRQALLHVVDRQQVADTVFFGQAPAATSVLSSATPGYVDVSKELTVDPAAAGEALDAAGWTRTGNGTRSKDGRELRLQASFNPAIGTGQAVLELVQQQLAKVGIALDIRKITQAELTDTLTKRDYGLFYNSQVRPDPDVLWSQYSPDSPSNRHGGSDPELARVLAEQRTTTDAAQRDPLTAQAQQRIVADGFGLPVVESVGVFGVAADVHGFGWEASGKPVFHDIWKQS
ncbi:ABC transporter substrate-binding protein [Kineococcus rhizosphaerae]|uniref:Peptide/nickel transport system substrate-binding protein n=1 Tax=Kineococcus rhizosphaerae TaxID=559628 RepID=A0A2T0R196_9ACTN|nr:ABC transporter substrate-binding protein [Kineococcus rhizosphaerae]PRY13068.1 peptide/nickel transport system substrate-binding protein [Kineococcus rhizosphaerae]